VKNEKKTKTAPMDELSRLRERIGELEASEKRYRDFVESVEDACLEMDLAGQITFGNDALCRNLGFTRDELLQMKRWQLFPTLEESDRIAAIYHEIFRTGIPRKIVDYSIQRKDGTIRNIEASISLIRDENGKPTGFRGICRDVTEQKKIEADQERYRNFVENVEDCCFETDLSGNFTFVNRVMLNKFGYSMEEALGMNFKSYIPEKDIPKIYSEFHSIYQTGKPLSLLNHEIIHKDGSLIPLELSVSLIYDIQEKPAGFRGISRDITEKRKMQAIQERYRAFIENIEDGCWEIDLKGYCTFCNQATLDQFGYTAEEHQTITARDYTTREEGKRVREIYKEMFRTGKPIKVHDQEIVRKDGGIRILEVSASVIRDTSGIIVGARGINRDMTEHKRMAVENEKLMAQVHQVQKMESLGTLSGGIAHDFNNLLMGIQGYTSVILFHTDPSHPNFEKLQAIESQVRSGANLTKQLLGYARSGRYEVNSTDLNDLIQKTTNLFGRTKKEIRLFEKYGQALWPVEADAGQLEQVFLNLFVNAWQAMPGGGSLYVETQNVTLSESYVKPYSVSPGRYVKATVTDTGVGMDKATQQRIFEPFFTTKTMGRGTGLGLASVYGIIKGHKGFINVYSEKSHGTSFNIYLPVSHKKPVREEPVISETRRGHETILLVDDEQVITDVTGEMLTGLGYQILSADSGEKAVEIYKENGSRIDLVIMDMIMPTMGGGETFQQIKAINPKVKVILSSGYTLNGEAKHIMDQGVLAFLQKPYNLDELSGKIRAILGTGDSLAV